MKRPYEWVYNYLIYNARRKGQLASITYDDFLEFTKVVECIYCGADITWYPHNKGGTSIAYNLDRKNTLVGYQVDNVVVCCKICNRVKSDIFTHEEFLLLSPVLRRIRLSKELFGGEDGVERIPEDCLNYFYLSREV